MEAAEKRIAEILSEDKQYLVPGYQRPYSWNQENAKALVSDLLDAFDSVQPEYFLGSIIVIEKEKEKIFEIVDGQQRLTTISLLMASLRDLIKDQAAKTEIQKRILPVNPLTGEAGKPRLLVRKQDQRFYEKSILFENSGEIEAVSDSQLRIQENKKEILNSIDGRSENELKRFANYILSNTYLVFVKTGNFGSAYRLFNVLNNRGLDLTNGDLLKNKLFELANSSEREMQTIEDLWSEIEGEVALSLTVMDNFLGHHRTTLLANKAEKDLFSEFEQILKQSKVSPASFCEGLAKSAKNHKILRLAELPSTRTKGLMNELKEVAFDDWVAPILAAMNNGYTGEELDNIISIVEKITIQNWVRRLGRAKRNTVYYKIIEAVKSGQDSKAINTIAKDYSDEKEFISLLNGDFYGNQYALPMLLRLDREMQDDSVFKTYNKGITIEHVLPQTMADNYWTSRFTDTQHREMVHKIGNMVLLSGRKNSAAQNYPFHEKIDVYQKKNKNVSFDITKRICDEKDWSASVIEKRQKELIELASKVWKL